MAILVPLQYSSYTYPSTAAADVFFPISVHRPNVSRSSPRCCQLSDHQTPPLSPLSRWRTARTDKSLLNVSESCSEAELWAAANLRVLTFYEFNEQTFGVEDHKKYLADLEFEALKERVAGKKTGFRKVSCINATLPISLVSNISHDLYTACKFSHNEEDRIVVGTLDLNQCVSLPHEIVGMKPKTIGADFARAYLSNVCVAEEFQRNGFGYELMAKAKNVAEAWVTHGGGRQLTATVIGLARCFGGARRSWQRLEADLADGGYADIFLGDARRIWAGEARGDADRCWARDWATRRRSCSRRRFATGLGATAARDLGCAGELRAVAGVTAMASERREKKVGESIEQILVIVV